MKLKAGGKAVIIALIVGAVGYGASKSGYLDPAAIMNSSVPPKMDIPMAQNPTTDYTSTRVQPVQTNYQLKILTIPWNATLGLQFANGGQNTTIGSLMDKRGVKVRIERQDDYSQMITEQVAFATELANGVANPQKGAAFVIIMGDGYAAYVYGAKEALKKVGHDIEVVGALGYSRGEDKCGLRKNANPKGSLIAAVLRDGDWNICVKYASDNGIPINPSEKTYDPNAMNFVSTNSFVDADDKFINKYCEERQVVGTRETKKVCVDGTATWTPGDVKVMDKTGGDFKVLASTKEYLWQMPSILIGNKKWNTDNPKIVENILAAAFEGGEKVRSNDVALTQAANIAAKVFNEETGEYWKKYYKGVERSGVFLGGSTTIGLGDNVHLFGLNGNFNLFKSVYNVFGNIVVKYYPDVMPKVIPYDQVVNTRFIESLVSQSNAVAKADTPNYDPSAQVSTFAKRSYMIEFEFNKATFTPQAMSVLDDMLNQLSISGLMIQINGHTDGIGSPEANLVLSKKRAEAVKSWILANASSAFPEERVRTRGFGDTSPIADNKTDSGRAKNRRVEIQLLK